MRISESKITLRTAHVDVEGLLAIPQQARGIVLFVHGSGSSRFSSRNQQVARYLNTVGLATLLFDLLTTEENAVDQYSRKYRFDIPMLSERIEGAVDWLVQQPLLASLEVGLFGASTGAAAALICAANRPSAVRAVVSRGGRPDLAAEYLARVKAPTLLIVGGEDSPVNILNRQAATRLCCIHELAIVPGATHLFEEPGKLEQVCRLAGDWFRQYLYERAEQVAVDKIQ